MATGPWQPLATGEGATPMLKSLRAMNAQIYGSIFASAGAIGGDFTVSGNMFVSGNIELTGGGVFRTAASGIRVELTADSDVINFYDASGKVGAIGWQATPATLTFSSETGESLRIHADEVLVLRADDRVNIQSGAATDIELNAGAGGNVRIGGHVLPDSDDAWDLGSATRGFRQLFMAPGAPIYLNGGVLSGITHNGTHLVLFNDDAGDLYLDSRVDDRDIFLRAANGATLRTRLSIDGAGHMRFYNRSGGQMAEVNDNSLKFNDELYGSVEWTATGSTSYKAVVYNGTNYQLYRFSSRRDLKENIRDMAKGLSGRLHELRVRTFDMKESHRTGDDFADFGQHGLIADEVHAVFGDQAAAPGEDGEPDGWSDKFMVVMLIREAQEAKLRADKLEARIKELENGVH